MTNLLNKFIVLPILGEKYAAVSSIVGFALSALIVFFVFKALFSRESALEDTEETSETVPATRYNESTSYRSPARISDPITTNGNNIQLFHQTVPQEIFDLLWFSDGPFQNFYPTNYKKYDFEFFSANVRLAPDEPSAISIEIPLSKEICNDKLDYFPSYKRLSPAQRYTYLNWLKDITQPIDIGYVFIFYYGLERHILFGQTDEAIKMIYQLKLHHN
ncbi:MAG: TerB N-terminal domain-containing protein, partial [Filifactor alocis]|nr:TerB N-terminal domain-containing protein [Filifactor alocis]